MLSERESPVLTLKEAATFLHSSTWFIRTLVWDGKVRRQRLGKRLVVPRADLLKMIEDGWGREIEVGKK